MSGREIVMNMGLSAFNEAPSGPFDPKLFATVLAVRVHAVTVGTLLQQAVAWAKQGQRRTIAYANAHIVNIAYQDAGLRKFLNEADLVYCDGEGVRLAARLLGQNLPERMTGADLLLPLCRKCEEEGVRLFFLGSKAVVAATAAEKIKESCPGIHITTHHGYLSDPLISREAVQQVNNCGAGILLVGMGSPIQERWIETNRSSIRVPVVWTVGALFDFIAGVQPRGPQWIVSHGLEWVYRLWSDPVRLWKRYVLGNPLFLWRVLKSKWNFGV